MVNLSGAEIDTVHVALSMARSWLDVLHTKAEEQGPGLLAPEEHGRLQVCRLEVEAALAVVDQALAGP